MVDLFWTSVPLAGAITDLSSNVAAASSGAATLAVWGMSTRRSITDGGGTPEFAGAVVADGESKLVKFAVTKEPVIAVSVAAYRSDFLVVWQASSRGALFGMFVDAEGDVVGPLPDRQPFPIVAETTGTIVLQGTAATERGILVLWSEAGYLYATRVDASGNVGESLLIDPYPIVHSGTLAASTSGYLIAYLRPTGGGLADVMARLVPELPH